MEMRRLKGVLVERQKTYENCAKALGISIAAFSLKINGRTNFTCREAARLASFLNLSDREKIEIFLS